MSEQFSLGGFEPPRPTDSLFLALFPDADAVARIAALDRSGLQGRAQPPERLHLTLAHLGDFAGVPGDVVQAALGALRALRQAPFALSLDTVGSFPSRRAQKPYVLRGSAVATPLHAFQHRLVQGLLKTGALRRAEEGFEPHVTLSYETVDVPARSVAPISWIAREVVLVHSFLGQSRYEVLGRCALAAEAA